MSKLLIYHGRCPDGFASALVIHKKFPEGVDYYPGVYQKDPPDVKGKDVIMVDFCYKRPVMEQILKDANSLTWIDHHKSAIEDMEGLDIPGLRLLNQSACTLTWNYCFPYASIPKLLLYIEDIDLWKFSYPETKDVMHYVYSKHYHFVDYLKLLNECETNIQSIIEKGIAINERFQKDMFELMENNRDEMNIGGYTIPVCNVPYIYASEICSHLCKIYSRDSFAACYYFKKEGVVFSLRSLDEGIDVSKIAKLFGGGGHKHSAGFEISKKIFFSMIRNEV